MERTASVADASHVREIAWMLLIESVRVMDCFARRPESPTRRSERTIGTDRKPSFFRISVAVFGYISNTTIPNPETTYQQRFGIWSSTHHLFAYTHMYRGMME